MGTTARSVTKVGIGLGAAIAAYMAVGAFFAHADAAPTITSTIRDSSAAENIITSAHIGDSVHDVAQVSSSTSQTIPQGTVDFNVYANTSCSGTASGVQGGVSLVNGFATSTATTTGAAGLSFKVHYNGDNQNIATDGPCQPLTVTSTNASVTTSLSASTITAGASAHDSASLSNVTSNAGGSLTYSVYSDASCQTPFAGAGNVNVSNTSVPNSSDVVFNTPGTYYWQAVYHGDNNNNAATSTCGSEILTVQASQSKNSPAISTTLSTTSSTVFTGSTIFDSAALSGETANAGGSVTYTVYSDNACHTLYGNAGAGSVTNGTVQNSPNFVFNTPGTYYWQAVYGGDANNNIATSTCGSEVLTVAATPNKNSPTISTSLSTTSSTVATGSSISDSANLSGETASAGGTVSYNVYSNSSCTTLYAGAGVVNVSNGSVPNSNAVAFNTPGTYYWQAVYSGDSNNNPVTSNCTSEVIAVSDSGSSGGTTGNGTLSGQVFNDANDNGVQDSGETGLAGFTVHLYQSANFNNFGYWPIYKTAVTDANGNYSFTNLPDGTYSIEQVLKNGWKQTTDDYTSVTVSGGSGQSGLNFGDVVGPKGKQHGHGTEKSHHGKNGHGNRQNCDSDDDGDDVACDSDNDNASSTHQWIFNVNINGNHDNGLHLGWFIGKGNQGKSKHGGN